MTVNSPVPLGYCEDDTCNRTLPGLRRCLGVILIHPSKNCSCHLSPPCSSCTSPRAYCDTCGWDERDMGRDDEV